MTDPLQSATDALAALNAQKTSLSTAISEMAASGVSWRDERYQQIKQQYDSVTKAIPRAEETFNTAYNAAYGIIGSSRGDTGSSGSVLGQSKTFGASASPYQGGNVGNAQGLTNTYAQRLAAQGVSITPIGNLLPAATYTPQQQYNRAAEQIVPNPQPTAPENQANTIATFLQQAGFSQESARIVGDITARNNPSAYTTQYAAQGDRTQQELLNTRMAVDRTSGEIGYYQVPINPYTGQPRTGIYGLEGGGILIGGGGRNAAQSGMFSTGVAGTPDIRTQYNPEKYAPTAYVPMAEIVRANPDAFSRLGAELYFGQVAPLDGRKLTSETQISRYPAWTGNLANLVQQIAPEKSAYPGANIPWAIPLSSPDSMYMDTRGITGAAPSAYNRKASMEYEGVLFGMGSRAGIQNPTVEGPRLIIGGAEGTRYGESIVAKPDRLVGGKTVAAAPSTIDLATPAGVEAAIQAGAIKKPFVSGTVIEPTGEVFGYKIPGISDVIAFVTPKTFVSGRASSVTEVDPKKTGGLDYANTFIQPETQQPTRTLVEKVGNPTATTSINPDTGKLETTITQEIQTTTLPEMKTVYGFTGVQQRSGYETFLDENYRSKIPDVATGERALEISQLFNPLNQQENIASAASRTAVFGAAERLGFDTTEARRNTEYTKTFTSPTKGQYALAYERPELAAVEYATAGSFGLATRGVTGLISRVPALERAATVAAPVTKFAGNYVLPGIYGTVIASESTKGFTQFEPENLARLKSHAVIGGGAMVSGFGAGYSLPETVGAARASYVAGMSQPYTRGRGLGEDAVLGGSGKPFRLESGRMSSYEQLKTEPQKYVPTAKLGDYTPLPQYAKDVKAPSFMEPTPQVRVIKEVPAKVESLTPVKRAFVLGQQVPREAVLTTTKKIPSIPEPFTGRVEPATTSQKASGAHQVLILEQKPASQIKTIDLAQETQILQVGKTRMMETVSQSTLRTRKSTEETGTLFGTGVRNIQRIAGKAEAQVTLGQMKTQQQLPNVEGVADSQFGSTANIKERSIISLRDAMTRASYVQGEAVKSGLAPALATSAATLPALTSTQKAGFVSMEGAKSVLKIPVTEATKSRWGEEPFIKPSAKIPIETVETRRVVPTAISKPTTTPESTKRTDLITTPRTLTETITRSVPSKTPIRESVTTTVPPPKVPVVPIPPIFPQLDVTSSGRGGSGQRTRVFSEYFRVGTGIGQINIAPPRNTRRQAPQPRSIQRSPINDAFASQARKKPRKMKF